MSVDHENNYAALEAPWPGRNIGTGAAPSYNNVRPGPGPESPVPLLTLGYVDAPYFSGNGTGTLVFRYVVGVSDETARLEYEGTTPNPHPHPQPPPP